MAIRDFLTRKVEDFMKALTTLVQYKNSLQWEKALDFIEEKRDVALLQAMQEGSILNDKEKRDVIEFQLKLSFYEVEISKAMERFNQEKSLQLYQLIDKFLWVNQDTYYMELEEMKGKLK